MALSCAIIPTIKDSTGKERESTLFKDLLKYTGYNRPVTKDIYSRVKIRLSQKIQNPYSVLMIWGNLPYPHCMRKQDWISFWIKEP